MIKFPGVFAIGFSVSAICVCFVSGFTRKPESHADPRFDSRQAKNNRPVVKILDPKNGSIHPLNSPIRYSVSVSDVEDGESKYDEIPSGNIFMEIRFMAGPLEVKGRENQSLHDEPEGLRLMRNSDCFTCHQFKTKLIGPSFQEIAARYPNATPGKSPLTGHIIQGSSGIWGELVMPAHPDLTPESSEKIVDWILKNGSNPALDYLMGKEGAFRIVPPPAAHDGIFVLTAYYTDKGNLMGKDAINIRYK